MGFFSLPTVIMIKKVLCVPEKRVHIIFLIGKYDTSKVKQMSPDHENSVSQTLSFKGPLATQNISKQLCFTRKVNGGARPGHQQTNVADGLIQEVAGPKQQTQWFWLTGFCRVTPCPIHAGSIQPRPTDHLPGAKLRPRLAAAAAWSAVEQP